MENSSQPDWEIGKLYNLAWQIIKQHKVLWLFGMATAGLSFNFGANGGGGNIDSLQKIFEKSPPPTEVGPEQISQVLGAATSTSFVDTFGQLFSSIPTSFYFILALEFVILIVAGFVISLIGSAWANASLLNAIASALSGKNVTIRDSSEKAFPNIKSLIWLAIVPTLILMGLIFVAILLVVIAVAVDLGPLRLLIGIVGGLTVGAVIYAAIFLSLASIWAPRIVVFEGKGGKESLLAGYKMSKKKFWQMVLLGLVNSILSGIVVGIPILIILGFIVGGVFAFGGSQVLGMSLLGVGVVLVIALLFGFALLAGILNAFKGTVWTIAYNNIKGKYA